MPGPELPDIPATLKSIQGYLKIATEHDQRDVVISYWCRVYALQTGLKLTSKKPEETAFLVKLMEWLETTKKANRDNEAITNEVAAEAHIDNWAHKLFLFADKNDRASNFGKNVVQSFYTAGLLYDVLTIFGALSDEAGQNRKYAKWKAAYIHNCLKNGETPVPGPATEDNEDDANENENEDEKENVATSPGKDANEEINEAFGFKSPPVMPRLPPTVPPAMPSSNNFYNPASPIGGFGMPPMPMQPILPSNTQFPSVPDPTKYNTTPIPTGSTANSTIKDPAGGVELGVEKITKAQKYIKWAGSALNYDDVETSVTNLQKALHLLTTGEDPV